MLILLNDSRISSVPVRDRGEKFVCLRGLHPRLLIDESRSRIASRSDYFCYARREVARRLAQAASSLPSGYRLCVKEAYRPLERQQKSFDEAYAEYKIRNPGASGEELYELTCQYVAPVEVAGHPTGGAVDVTLFYGEEELDMGTEFNDEPIAPYNLTYLESPWISAQARENRRRLTEIMEGIDFVNYPTEWWHWSYGDPYWAYFHQCEAIYKGCQESRLP